MRRARRAKRARRARRENMMRERVRRHTHREGEREETEKRMTDDDAVKYVTYLYACRDVCSACSKAKGQGGVASFRQCGLFICICELKKKRDGVAICVLTFIYRFIFAAPV